MATPIAMPRQGNTVESCTIQEWFKKKGDVVAKGEALFSYETDKASFEFESPVDGTLLETFFEASDEVPVLTNVAVIGAAGENIDSFRPQAVSSAPEKILTTVQSEAPKVSNELIETKSASSTTGISPRAKKTAEKNGIDPFSLSGTGPKGRVIERDIFDAIQNGVRLTPAAALLAVKENIVVTTREGSSVGGRISLNDLTSQKQTATVPAAAQVSEVKEVKLSSMRKIIASRMLESLQKSAQLTMNASAKADGLLNFRKQVKAAREQVGIEDITITDLLLFALSRTLVKFPDINALLNNDIVAQHDHAHVAVAVDTPRGLMVPVIRYADRLSLNDISKSLKQLSSQCREGSINPDLLSGGTFTVSNLGQFGIESFTPVLNLPQVALLGVNTIAPKACTSSNGDIIMAQHIGLSLTIDHRAIDGAAAARFLKSLVIAIENITLTLSL